MDCALFAGPLDDLDFLRPQTLHALVSLLNVASLFQVAIKNNMGVHYFQDSLRLQDCLVPSGKIEGSEYPTRWGAMQAANQAVSPLTGFPFEASLVQERLQVYIRQP
jgi:hypothetical protein